MAANPTPQSMSSRVAPRPTAAIPKKKLTPLEAWQEMMRKRMLAMNVTPALKGTQYDPSKAVTPNPRLVRPASNPLTRPPADSSQVGPEGYSQNPNEPYEDEYIDAPAAEKPGYGVGTAASTGLGAGGLAAAAEGIRQLATGSKPSPSSIPAVPGPSALSGAIPTGPMTGAYPSATPSSYPATQAAMNTGETMSMVPPAIPGAAPGVTPTAFGGGTGIMSAGWAPPAAAVAAYQAPSAIKGIKNLTSSDGNRTDGAIKTVLNSNPTTSWATPLLDAAGINFGEMEEGKQARRDNLGNFMSNTGELVGDDYTVALPDGRRVSIGGDTFRDEKGNPITGVTPDDRAYNLDWNDPRVPNIVALIDPLVLAGVGPDAKNKEQMVAKLANLALLTDDPEAAVRGFYDNAGLTRDSIYNAIKNMPLPKGQERDSYLATIDRMYGIQPNTGESEIKGSSGGSGRSDSTPAPLPPPPPVFPTASVPEQFGYQNFQPPARPYDQAVNDIINVQASNQSQPMDMQTNPLTRSLYRRRY